LRRNSNGTLGYHIIQGNNDKEKSSGDEDDCEEKGSDDKETDEKIAEKAVTIGNLMEGLQASSYSMASYAEEKKNKNSASEWNLIYEKYVILDNTLDKDWNWI